MRFILISLFFTKDGIFNFKNSKYISQFENTINIIRNKECELARIYRFITLILKMKPNEHEFKVMGLAPYSKIEYSMEVYNKVFKDILDVKDASSEQIVKLASGES